MAVISTGVGNRVADWITPERQLEKLIRPDERVIEEVDGTRSRPGALPVRAVATIVAEYVADLSPSLTNWHTALDRLNMLPEKLPPLPLNIHDQVSDTQLLYLIPPGSLNEFEARVSAYGQEHLAEYGGINPLRFSYFWDAARLEYGNTRFDEWHWVIWNDVSEESRNKSYKKQVQMVAELSERALVHYEIPRLREAAMLAFLHKVATGESVLAVGYEQNQYRYTYTRVQETTQGYHLAVGGFAPGGLLVISYGFDDDYVGVAALRKFEVLGTRILGH